jgi:hypothetical protein
MRSSNKDVVLITQKYILGVIFLVYRDEEGNEYEVQLPALKLPKREDPKSE